MSSTPELQLSPVAYIKIILHSAKYPVAGVLGLLVGRSVESNKVLIEDVVPLSHQWSALTPMSEVGCALTEAHVASTSQGSSSIIGCYEVPAKLTEDKVSAPCTRLAQRIAGRSAAAASGSSSPLTGRALVILLNNQLLLSPTYADPFITSIQPAPKDAGAQSSPTPLAKGSIRVAGVDHKQAFQDASLIAAKLLQEGVAARIADFDDHLADPSLDWLQNKRLQTAIPRVA